MTYSCFKLSKCPRTCITSLISSLLKFPYFDMQSLSVAYPSIILKQFWSLLQLETIPVIHLFLLFLFFFFSLNLLKINFDLLTSDLFFFFFPLFDIFVLQKHLQKVIPFDTCLVGLKRRNLLICQKGPTNAFYNGKHLKPLAFHRHLLAKDDVSCLPFHKSCVYNRIFISSFWLPVL